MKRPSFMILLLLSGCGGDRAWIPEKQDMKFKCDMDPYRQDCAKRSDYDRHLEMIRTEKQTRRLLRNQSGVTNKKPHRSGVFCLQQADQIAPR